MKGNIDSADLVNYVLETEKIDTIMHFAAQTHVGKCSEPPTEVFPVRHLQLSSHPM